MMTKAQIVETLATVRSGSTFLVIRGYKNNQGEKADHCIAFHISYKECLNRSMQMIQNMKVETELDSIARAELIEQYAARIRDLGTPFAEKDDGYMRFTDSETGKIISGVRYHPEKSHIHVFGLTVWKKVLEKGEYKTVNSRPLTIAKKTLESKLPISRFRSFVVDANKFDQISVDKQEILPPLETISKLDELINISSSPKFDIALN